MCVKHRPSGTTVPGGLKREGMEEKGGMELGFSKVGARQLCTYDYGMHMSCYAFFIQTLWDTIASIAHLSAIAGLSVLLLIVSATQANVQTAVQQLFVRWNSLETFSRPLPVENC